MIAEPLTVSPTTVARVLNEMCDTIARGERPLTSYSAIAGKDGDVSIEHAYVGPAAGGVPPQIETTVYVDESRFEHGTTLWPDGGLAAGSTSLLADDAGGPPTRLADLGSDATRLIETLEAIAASTAHLSGYSPDGDGFDPVCVDVYPGDAGSEESAAFRGYFEIDELIATRRSGTPQSTV